MNLDPPPSAAPSWSSRSSPSPAPSRRGRRPSFDHAARPEEAEPLIEALIADLRSRGFQVETGRFRADMQVSLVNDGPVTLVADF